MMRLFTMIRIISIFLFLLLLSGCWSSTNLANQHYVTTLGLDYDGETYYIYAQIIRFENVARLEGQGSSSKENTYVGKGSGPSVNMAAADLYSSAQVRIDWGQTRAIIVSHRALQTLDSEIVERIYRFPENRYNTWLYVTEDSIEEIMLTNSFYERTSLFSILHMPTNTFRQYSTIPPIRMFKYLSYLNEPDRIIQVPCIGFNEKSWKSNEKQLKLLEVTGGYFETTAGVKRTFTKKQLKGMRWMDPRMSRTMLLLQEEQKIYGVLTIENNKIKSKVKLVNGEPRFVIKATYKGSLKEYIEEIEYDNMIAMAEGLIKEEIMQMYKVGVEEEIDLFNLMHYFRFRYPTAWKNLTKNGEQFILTEQSIERLDIEVVVPYNGKYKRQI